MGDWLRVQAICDEADILVPVEAVRFDEIKDDIFKGQVLKDKKVLYERARA